MEPILVRVALYVQAVAALEVALDDVLLLANSRRKDLNFSAGRYPVRFNDKLRLLELLCASGQAAALPDKISERALELPLEVRNWLAHGVIIKIAYCRTNYSLTVAKVSLPDNVDGQQFLTRREKELSDKLILECAVTIDTARDGLDDLYKKIFRAGEGWPSYLAQPLADPLGLKTVSRRIGF